MRPFALLALVLLSACSEQEILSSIEPFPCAKDGTCPTGYQCKAGAAGSPSTCVSTTNTPGFISGEKALDEVCSPNDICKDGYCEYGVCSPPPATSNTSCPLNHPVNGEFACLMACNSDSDCGAGLTCTSIPIGYGGALEKGCVATSFAAFQDRACNGNTPGECGPTGTPYDCIGGACELSCGSFASGRACPSDRVCMAPQGGATTRTACFFDCSGGRDGGPSGGTCPNGATHCTTFTGDPGSYCSP